MATMEAINNKIVTDLIFQSIGKKMRADQFCRTITMELAFAENCRGTSIYVLNNRGVFVQIGFFGDPVVPDEPFTQFDDNIFSQACRNKTIELGELETGEVTVFPIMNSNVPAGVLVCRATTVGVIGRLEAEFQEGIYQLLGVYLGQLGINLEDLVDAGDADPSRLTQRQRVILDMKVRGLTAAQIGEQLNLSESSIKQETRRIHQVLGTGSKHQLVTAAISLGLVRQA